jgi:hypothetical protein
VLATSGFWTVLTPQEAMDAISKEKKETGEKKEEKFISFFLSFFLSFFKQLLRRRKEIHPQNLKLMF